MPYSKSNKEIQDSAFRLRSGNTTPFKQIGSSPLRQIEGVQIVPKKPFRGKKVRMLKGTTILGKTIPEIKTSLKKMFGDIKHAGSPLNPGLYQKKLSPSIRKYLKKIKGK